MIRPMWNRWDWSSDPFSDLRQVERQMNRLFRDIHDHGREYPSLNFWSNDDEAHLEIEMPGVEPDNFDLTVSDDIVTIEGERKNPLADDEETAHRQERTFGKFSRTVQLPFEADADKVTARYENGVLRVTLPRSDVNRTKRIAIKAA